MSNERGTSAVVLSAGSLVFSFEWFFVQEKGKKFGGFLMIA